jgi:hypothetical protein
LSSRFASRHLAADFEVLLAMAATLLRGGHDLLFGQRVSAAG